MELEQAVRQKLMVIFDGMQAPESLLADLRSRPFGGFTLFRDTNIANPAQLRQLTGSLQAAARANGELPLLIGADQEGGQLMGLGDGTPFPGNMALGAAGDEDLARRVGNALGLEMAAVGVNINYAPVVDVCINPLNPSIGTRSFGQDPALVARLGAAVVRGIQSAGIAATAKHFPGHGDTQTDSHFGTPIVPYNLERLRQVELPPFQAAIQAGVRLIMTAHLALPALNEGTDIPATLSRPVLRGLLRDEMGFEGLIITDAMNMHAIAQGPNLLIDALTSISAGADLLLLVSDPAETQAVYEAVLHAARRRLLYPRDILASAERILSLKRWLSQIPQPPLSVIRSTEHQVLALEVARRSITLVRDQAGLLPLHLRPGSRIAVVIPRPQDLTPADTSSATVPAMAEALRQRHPTVDEFILPLDPEPDDISALCETVHQYDLVIAGSISTASFPGQAALIQAIMGSGVPTIMVALRAPFDLTAYPAAPTCLCTYSILPPSMEALAEGLFGEIPFSGRLPVSLSAE